MHGFHTIVKLEHFKSNQVKWETICICLHIHVQRHLLNKASEPKKECGNTWLRQSLAWVGHFYLSSFYFAERDSATATMWACTVWNGGLSILLSDLLPTLAISALSTCYFDLISATSSVFVIFTVVGVQYSLLWIYLVFLYSKTCRITFHFCHLLVDHFLLYHFICLHLFSLICRMISVLLALAPYYLSNTLLQSSFFLGLSWACDPYPKTITSHLQNKISFKRNLLVLLAYTICPSSPDPSFHSLCQQLCSILYLTPNNLVYLTGRFLHRANQAFCICLGC